jgi:N-acetylglucosaminyl-diphospho-decaprenol L-rhamnosyltransferase
MSIHILVLNYNGLELLKECMPSLWEACQNSPQPCKLSVLDNCSRDGSRAWLAENLPGVGWLAAPENRILFSYNAVLEKISEPLVLLLNNDIKVEKDFIAPLLRRLEARPEAFCASPLHLDFDGIYNGGMNRCGFRLSLPWAGPGYRGAAEEAKIPGETLFTGNGLFRREKILALGGFDPLFEPMGWEDCDLGTRAWLRGWPSLYEPASVIHHKSSASISKAYARSERDTLGFRNAFIWFYANFASGPRLARFFALLPLTLLLFLATGRISQWRGFWASLPRLGRALARRRRERGMDVMEGGELLLKFKGSR